MVEKSVKPLILMTTLFLLLLVSAQVFHLLDYGPRGFAFAATTVAALGSLLWFTSRKRQPPERKQEFIESIPGLAWTAECDGQISSMNSQMREFLSIPSDSLSVPATSIHPEDRHKTFDLWTQQNGLGKPGTHRLLGPDGRYHWFRSVVQPVRDADGVAIWSWGTFIDIDDLKAAEDALRSSEENLRSILDHIPGQISTADGNGLHDYCNRIAETFYGHSFHELNGMGFARFVHPDDLDGYITEGWKHIKSGVPIDRPVRLLRHDGVYRWFRIRINPAFDANGNVVRWYGLHSDIDDEVRMLENLQQAQDKLAQASEFASLAELAASIAHEVNQPLSAVVTNSEACQVWLSSSPPNLDRARISADRIVRDAKEAADVVRRIRELFAQKVPHKGRISINEIIEDVVDLIRKKYSSRGLTVATSLDPGMPLIFADRIQIQQVVFNVARNGVESMQSNGEDPMTLDISSRYTGDTAIVEIADNGVGLDDPHKVFEPFFTTKTDGMGMGLSICRSIVDAHNGRLWAQARPSRGAVFAFELPIQDAGFHPDRDRVEILHKRDVERL
ncbi:PAS domain-containing protein [Rhizobium laguerreae]|uniref:PAS domain-containing sensor histidine kinase n=1 Tax=Rhizobium laguerreae TaxID=1076926 RepID=UPI001C913200|nr:PAS domain-containing sensor histidine kinase [Rhizobium laguerreae]MBY3537567.1 PAS domain-containing protein [Rhizobium laguerreae]